MKTKSPKYPKLPSREIAYAYTVAMHFAQQFEQNLRAILYTRHYLEKGADLHLTPEEIWHLKSKEGFIDKPACAAILKKFRKSALIKGQVRAAFEAFNSACAYRNELAHWFLAEQNFDKMSSRKEKEILRELYEMSLGLYRAYELSSALYNHAEYNADEHNGTDQQALRKMMLADAHEEILKQLMGDARGFKQKRRPRGKK